MSEDNTDDKVVIHSGCQTVGDLEHMGLESFYGTIGSGARTNKKSNAWIAGFYYGLKHFKHLTADEQRKFGLIVG